MNTDDIKHSMTYDVEIIFISLDFSPSHPVKAKLIRRTHEDDTRESYAFSFVWPDTDKRRYTYSVVIDDRGKSKIDVFPSMVRRVHASDIPLDISLEELKIAPTATDIKISGIWTENGIDYVMKIRGMTSPKKVL
jgi:hypothetical protein